MNRKNLFIFTGSIIASLFILSIFDLASDRLVPNYIGYALYGIILSILFSVLFMYTVSSKLFRMLGCFSWILQFFSWTIGLYFLMRNQYSFKQYSNYTFDGIMISIILVSFVLLLSIIVINCIVLLKMKRFMVFFMYFFSIPTSYFLYKTTYGIFWGYAYPVWFWIMAVYSFIICLYQNTISPSMHNTKRFSLFALFS